MSKRKINRYRVTVEFDMPTDINRSILNDTIREAVQNNFPIGADIVYLATDIIQARQFPRELRPLDDKTLEENQQEFSNTGRIMTRAWCSSIFD
jgi:hypothetical protein